MEIFLNRSYYYFTKNNLIPILHILRHFVKLLLGHRIGILNGFDYRISTGPVEGFNNKIQVL